jgi:UDP-N-acetylglucosamine diphosphorylase/glucosamine-1-phosphate N-acetyltransferase
MSNYILFDDTCRDNLLPFTYTRPVCDLRTGILTIREKWEILLGHPCSYLTQKYLQSKFRLKTETDNIIINGSVLPDLQIIEYIKNLKPDEALIKDDYLIAVRLSGEKTMGFSNRNRNYNELIQYGEEVLKLNYPWDIFTYNGTAISSDYKLITKNRRSAGLSKTVNVLNPGTIFVEEGAKVEFATLNAESGPIYIGKDSEIMEGSLIRGPFALCDKSAVKLGAKIYGPTTIGPHCKAGGEINNSVFLGYANKSHDGFLGNSVIGEWCNIGADSNNSNLKNNYSEVKVWDHATERFISSGLQFCGLFMGDHSKCGINTMFNTGTMVGVFANIFGTGFPRNFIPSFSWGGPNQGFTVYNKADAFKVAKLVMERRNMMFDETEKKILEYVFELTEKHRKIQ